VGDHEIVAQCMFRLGLFNELRETLSRSTGSDSLEEAFLHACAALLADEPTDAQPHSRNAETETAAKSFVDQALKRWRTLPAITCDAHAPLLAVRRLLFCAGLGGGGEFTES
jgi:hypothetical protein